MAVWRQTHSHISSSTSDTVRVIRERKTLRMFGTEKGQSGGRRDGWYFYFWTRIYTMTIQYCRVDFTFVALSLLVAQDRSIANNTTRSLALLYLAFSLPFEENRTPEPFTPRLTHVILLPSSYDSILRSVDAQIALCPPSDPTHSTPENADAFDDSAHSLYHERWNPRGQGSVQSRPKAKPLNALNLLSVPFISRLSWAVS